jgi:hypothetical protein
MNWPSPQFWVPVPDGCRNSSYGVGTGQSHTKGTPAVLGETCHIMIGIVTNSASMYKELHVGRMGYSRI